MDRDNLRDKEIGLGGSAFPEFRRERVGLGLGLGLLEAEPSDILLRWEVDRRGGEAGVREVPGRSE
jgi:hypothetical protein